MVMALDKGWYLYDKYEMKTTTFMGREKTHEPILIFKQKQG